MLKMIIAGLALLFVHSDNAAGNTTPEGKHLAQQVYDYYIGDNSLARMSMELVDRNGRSRMRNLISMTMDENDVRNNFIRFLEPPDIAGTGFLSIEQKDGNTEQFLYLPALNRTRRIVSAQRGRSFVNTDFTYEDMERRPVEDAEYQTVGREVIDGRDCWILEVRPLPHADSQYSLIKNWIPRDIALPVKAHYYDHHQKHIKTYVVQDLEEIQGIWTPVHVIMFGHTDKHKTVIITEEIEYNSQQVQESFFTTRFLENW